MADKLPFEWLAYEQALAAYRAATCKKIPVIPSFASDPKSCNWEAYTDNLIMVDFGRCRIRLWG